ncbi:DNA repair protein RecO [Aureibacter tunicatorum]|uniref:DNA repair protein RecO n=1 Tax=Aureibacter tunicatorum TaxID=866807 RepID=A0AAE3XLP0_9BACT|nr:DNA repair protein RecO [Aureibacter tunicatorum]MDR6238732.1 DNA repair protein RecO (recombination protein O) [Aureibacter tunicatorum]BDD05337.1 hypothetical protein AUTU_28200 [Aureibacter tunicatorum]
MVHHTKGIVLNFVKFKETSIIVKLFTEKFGTQSYIVNGVRSSKAKGKMAMFQPFTLLDMQVYHKPNADINRISELHIGKPFFSIPYDVHKSAITIFLTEFCAKVLFHEESNPPLYNYLEASMELFDNLETGKDNFHLQFMVKLSSRLGIAFETAEEFSRLVESHFPVLVSQEEKEALKSFLDMELGGECRISNGIRSSLFDLLLKYYQYHYDNISNLKSIHVLKEVFH